MTNPARDPVWLLDALMCAKFYRLRMRVWGCGLLDLAIEELIAEAVSVGARGLGR